MLAVSCIARERESIYVLDCLKYKLIIIKLSNHVFEHLFKVITITHHNTSSKVVYLYNEYRYHSGMN